MNLTLSEVCAVIRFRLDEFTTRIMSLKAEERAKAPEVAQRLLEAAQALVEESKK